MGEARTFITTLAESYPAACCDSSDRTITEFVIVPDLSGENTTVTVAELPGRSVPSRATTVMVAPWASSGLTSSTVPWLGVAEIDGTEHALQLGHTVDIPLKATHRVSCTSDTPLVFIEIQYGNLLDENDIIRLSDDYNRI